MKKCPVCGCKNEMFKINKCLNCGWLKGEDKDSKPKKKKNKKDYKSGRFHLAWR